MAKNKKLKFYIVEDDADVIEFMTEILEAAGHSVVSNIDSGKAIAEIISQKPDFVIADLMMPGMDGLVLCKELRSRKELSDTKIVIVSAKAYDYDRKRAKEFGADGFIARPLRRETFIEKVNRIHEDKIELTFWGVRGTLPVPGQGSLKYGGNTSCVSMEFSKDQLFIFDAGTGIKVLSDHLMAQQRNRIEAEIFISHPHWDHINALPFFAPLYIPGSKLKFHGASHGNFSMEELISSQMDGVYFPITIQDFAANVSFNDLKEETFEVNGISIKTMLLSHPGYCLGYRVEYRGRSICYITDNELFMESSPHHDPGYVKKLISFINGTEVLITDCTYTDAEYESKIGWSHSSIGTVVDLAHRAEVKGLYLFHHDPDQNDDDIDAKLDTATSLLLEMKSKTKVLAPKEGLTIKV